MGYLTIFSLVAIAFACFGSSEGGSMTVDPYTYEWFGEARVPWGLASFICKVKGGRLVDIESEVENYLILSLIQKIGYREGIWIGRHGHFNQSAFVMAENGEYTNWAEGQPSKHGNSEVCVVIEPQNGEWKTVSCNWGYFLKYEPRHPWLCKYGKAATTTPTPSANETTTNLMAPTYAPTGNETSTEQYKTTYEPTGNETSTEQYSTTYEPTGNEASTEQYSTTYKPTGNETSTEQYSTTYKPTGNETFLKTDNETNESTSKEMSN